MGVDVEPGMRIAAAVAWKAAANMPLFVLASSLLDEGCFSSVYCRNTPGVAAAAAIAAAAGAAASRGDGGPQEALRPSRWWS